MTYGEIINHMLKGGRMPSMEWINDLRREHPTFIVPLLMILKRSGTDIDPDTFTGMQTTAVLNCADRIALADYIDPTGAGWATFYPPVKPREITTEETIDDFLKTFGQTSTPEEDALLEKIIFNPVAPDYFADTDEPYDPTDPLALPPELAPKQPEEKIIQPEEKIIQPEERINQPVEEPSNPTPTTPIAPEERLPLQKDAARTQKEIQTGPSAPDESLLMESLAKIFIKQRRYERAFEIISKLSLNYPEKSVYFADQLRFLQKLIINQQHQAK